MNVDHDMYALSWYYLYGVGGLIYALGAIACIRTGVLDLKVRQDKRIFISVTGCLVLFAGVHALFQFVLPFTGQSG